MISHFWLLFSFLRNTVDVVVLDVITESLPLGYDYYYHYHHGDKAAFSFILFPIILEMLLRFYFHLTFYLQIALQDILRTIAFFKT